MMTRVCLLCYRVLVNKRLVCLSLTSSALARPLAATLGPRYQILVQLVYGQRRVSQFGEWRCPLAATMGSRYQVLVRLVYGRRGVSRFLDLIIF